PSADGDVGRGARSQTRPSGQIRHETWITPDRSYSSADGRLSPRTRLRGIVAPGGDMKQRVFSAPSIRRAHLCRRAPGGRPPDPVDCHARAVSLPHEAHAKHPLPLNHVPTTADRRRTRPGYGVHSPYDPAFRYPEGNGPRHRGTLCLTQGAVDRTERPAAGPSS